MADRGGVFAGLDLGTTKICAILLDGDGEQTSVIGVGTVPSDGLRKGVVVDVGRTVASIEQAVREAEVQAGVAIGSVYAGIAGEHIGSLDSVGAVAVGGKRHEICAADRERAIDAARTVAIPFDREVLHVLPQEFAVDDQRGVRDPVGMFGVRLEAAIHIVTGAVTSVQNVCKSVQRAGLQVADIVLEPLASGRAVVTDEEKEMGVCLLDVGGGTADLALYFQGSVRKTAVIGLGGQNVTRDVAICLRTSWTQAERLKRAQGAAVADEVDHGDERIEVPGVAGRVAARIPRSELAAIIEARMAEIYELARARLDRSAYGDMLAAGIVLTGGGALVPGADRLAERVFERPVRLGAPRAYPGLGELVASPVYSTAIGLALLAADAGRATAERGRDSTGLADGAFDSVAGRMKEWFSTLL